MDLRLPELINPIEIRDVIHSSIILTPAELAVVDSPFFQRLRNIKQLGFSEAAYPCATHNRYTHSIGAMHLAGRIFKNVFRFNQLSHEDVYWNYFHAARCAVLLHDIGHGPFSHAIEKSMPQVKYLGLAPEITGENPERLATHEDYSIKILTDSSLTDVINKNYGQFGINAKHIAALVDTNLSTDDDFFVDNGVDYRKLLHQIVSSEIDADRMDYLQRDSYYTGVSYGNFDRNWLLSNISHHIIDGKAHLAISSRASYTFEDYLLSRYHMFLMVYFHHKSVIYEKILHKYLESENCSYQIPTDLEKYIYYDDTHLINHLREQKNEWAQRIVQRKPYKLALEIHGSRDREENPQNSPVVREFEEKLQKSNTHYIKTFDKGAMSKYFKRNSNNSHRIHGEEIYVAVNNRLQEDQFVLLEDYTDLFRRYAEDKRLVRIYTPD